MAIRVILLNGEKAESPKNEITGSNLPVLFKNSRGNCSSAPLLEAVSGYSSSPPDPKEPVFAPRLNKQTTPMWGPAMQLKCGYPVKKWNDAERQIRAVLIERAKAGDIIPYVELTRNITAIQLEPQSFALTIMLREIAAEENATRPRYADRHSCLQLGRHAAWSGFL